MEKKIAIMAPLIISVIGILNIFSPWYSILVEGTLEGKSYLLDKSYSGISALTSGDFTTPGSLLYGGGLLGVYAPIIIVLLFALIAAIFLIKMSRTMTVEDGKKQKYAKSVMAPAVLIMILAALCIRWVNPGTETFQAYQTDLVETHAFGLGPVLAIALAIALIVLAFFIDYIGSKETQTVQSSDL